MGPYLAIRYRNSLMIFPKKFQRIVSKTNIKQQYHKAPPLCMGIKRVNIIDFFTSKELADGLKMSKRSADRLIEKLLSADLAVLSTEQIKGSVEGQPALFD